MQKHIRILHLEDDPLDAELVRARLDSDGVTCDIMHVDNRDDFVKALNGRSFDVILADYSLPMFDGVSALKIASEKCPDTPYIFVSGQIGEEHAVETLKAGATDYVIKNRLSRLAPSVLRALEEANTRAERRVAVEKVRKLNRVYAVLSAVNQLIVRTDDRQKLFEGACRIAVEKGQFLMSWVGLVDEETKTVKPVACTGCEESYLKTIKITSRDGPEGAGPTGRAVRTGRSFVNNDTENNPVMLPWRDEALRRGYRSSASFPIMSDGRAIGAFTVYAAEAGFFDEEEVRLLDRLAEDISYAMRSMEQEGLRKRAETVLMESEERFRVALKNSPVSVHNHDRELRYTWINDPDLAWGDFGYIGRTDADILGDDDGARLMAIKRQTLETGRSVRQEVAVTFLGEKHYLDLTVEPLHDPDGAVVGLTCATTDLTQLKRAEEETRDLNEKLQSLVEDALVGVYILQDGRFVYSNKRTSEILGLSSEEIAQIDVMDLIHPDDKALVKDSLEKRLSGEVKELGYEFRMLRKDGSTVFVEVLSSYAQFQRKPSIIGTVLDITERKELEQQKADFYAMVTHDFKSPLTTILGYSDFMMTVKADELNPDVAEMVADINKAGKKLNSMAEDFLALSRIDAGKQTVELFPMEIPALLSGCARGIESALKDNKLSFREEIEDDLPVVMFDKKLVSRAVSNLLHNAINYTPAGGAITLGAKKGNGSVVIYVTDTGPGISKEEQARVFDKYYRSPRTAGVKGTGLGLAIVKTVAEAHGGRVELESEIGKGSTFSIILPLG